MDGLLTSSASNKEIIQIKQSLSECYEMNDLGKVEKCVGLNINQGDVCIMVNLRDYIEKNMKELGFKDLHNTHTPLQKTVDYHDDKSPIKVLLVHCCLLLILGDQILLILCLFCSGFQ